MPEEKLRLKKGDIQLTLMITPSGTLTTRTSMSEKELIAELDGTAPRNGYAVIKIIPNEGHETETVHIWRQAIVSYIIVVVGEEKSKSSIVIPELRAPADATTRRS